MKLAHALRITPGDVVALVGGGGKTTAMFQLARELAGPMRVLTTTTTRIFTAQINRAPAHVTFDPRQQTLAAILPQLNAAITRHGQALLIGQADAQSGKAFGVSPEIIDRLAHSGQFDLIINEADGSRMRPFKAPAPHEPVISGSSTLVVPVVGIDALDQPLNDQSTHRAGQIGHLSGTPLRESITLETIASVLCHPQGGLKNVPAAARVVPLINKVEAEPQQVAAQTLADRLLSRTQIDAVAIGAVQQSQSPVAQVRGRTAAVLLAAGGSSRFGSPKQLARWGEQTFIERAVELALTCQASPVIVVLGAEVEQSRALLAGRPVKIVTNPNWARGQSSSMQAGLAALPGNVSSAVFLLVDLPGVSPHTIDALIERHRQTLAPLVWPEFEGKRGNPVLFDRALFADLQQVRGDTGGRPVLLAHKNRAERVAVDDAGILQDFDRPEDLTH